MKKTASAVVALALAVAPSARAADGLAVTLTPLGLPLGLGVDVTYRASNHFNLRLGGGLPGDGTVEGIEFGKIKYDVTLKFGGGNAFVDWYPWAGSFHVSGGVTTLREPWALEAERDSSYNVNGTIYPAAGVGKLTGSIDPGYKIAPALLIGWGNPVRPGKRWGFLIELGLAYAGAQDFELSANGPLKEDPAFRRDLAAESKARRTEHGVVPVFKAGVSFQF